MKKISEGSISVFLALVMLLIISLILVMLESAMHAASAGYAGMLLRTAEESVLGEYCGPLFADYHILALDTGFGSRTKDTDEFERRLKRYIGENVWNYSNESVKITDERKLLDDIGTEFLQQAVAYEKYAAAGDVLDEVLSRIKSLGNQKDITKIMEKKMGIEDELSVIDMFTLNLMGLIDGVTLTLGAKTSSMLGYTIEEEFIKRFFIGDVSMGGTGINNPSVYENLKNSYLDPIGLLNDYRKSLGEHGKLLYEIEDDLKAVEELEKKIGIYNDSLILKNSMIEENSLQQKNSNKKIEEYTDEINEAEEIEDEENAVKQIKKYEDLKQKEEEKLEELIKEAEDLNREIEEINTCVDELEGEKKEHEDKIGEKRDILKKQLAKCNDQAEVLYDLCSGVLERLYEVVDITDEVAEQQAKVRPMVEEFEELLKVFGPILGADTKAEFEETLDYMKAYIGMGNGRIKTTDFDSINRTAVYDIEIMEKVDTTLFSKLDPDSYEEVDRRLSALKDYDGIFSEFSYSGFYFDYSEIQENAIENKLVAEFENNVAEGYLKLFIKEGTELSKNYMLSELLPSYWYEIFEDAYADLDDITSGADDKGGGELLCEADEGSGISELVSLLGEGAEAVGSKLLEAMYMQHHFKSFRNKSSTGDTILDYEVEYILSGYETDMANLSAAFTKIMLIRLAVCTVYTMTNKETKAQAQILATSIVGFTGLPFLVSLVKYLILFLWAAAQAVVETAAIARGKKVPIITSKESFCISLAELPFFATVVSEKADEFYESNVYLDYDNYMLVLMLIQGEKTQAARAMDLIQENIRYKYDEDFLISNAVTGFSVTAEFRAPSKFFKPADTDGSYIVKVSDSVSY